MPFLPVAISILSFASLVQAGVVVLPHLCFIKFLELGWRKHLPPVHSQRIKDGKMTAWWLMSLEAPFGSSMPYNSVAVDLYPDMKAYLASWFDEYFKKSASNKNLWTLFLLLRTLFPLLRPQTIAKT